MTKPDLNTLLATTTGASKSLDKAIAKAFDVPLRDYSSSVDACIELIHEKLPTVHWHVGRAEDGVSMYATMVEGINRAQCTSGTVPLALLNVAVKFLGV